MAQSLRQEIAHPLEVMAPKVVEKVRSLAPHIGNVSLARRLTRASTYQQIVAEMKDVPKWRKIHEHLTAYSERTGDFFFVQIGANDGVTGDPIRRHVQQSGWSGLLVEPVPHVFAQLRKNYAGQPGLKFANVAVAQTDGTATMLAAVQLPGGRANPLSPVSTFDREVLRKHEWMADNPNDLTQPIDVPTRTLSTLFEEYGVRQLDGLFIDTEGYDKVVLDQLDLETHAPRFILYEHGHLGPEACGELALRFSTAGYDLTTLRRDTFAELV